ncbi:MAG TPA: beta-propeller fold lactonase family protein [Acidimicrobiales bacterium]|nr:beta-propeller fold lactonase family protein [Acidimicrobiales bacterium]
MNGSRRNRSSLLIALSLAAASCGTSGGTTNNNPPPGQPVTGATVTYDANGAKSGSPPTDSSHYASGQNVTVAAVGTLAFSGYAFVGWQTKADGSGTTYLPGATFAMGDADVTLYALWTSGYVYAVCHNGGSAGTVSQYTIGPNGGLTPMSTASVPTSGSDPRYLTADPQGRYVYAANITSSTIAELAIGAGGALTAVSSPFSLSAINGVYPAGLAVDPSGTHLYAAMNQRSVVGQFTIGSGGALTALTPATVAGGSYPDAVVVHPSGKWAYMADGGGNTVSQYVVDATTGALTAMSPATVATGHNAFELKVDASGKHLYVANYDDGTISQFNIDATSGALTPMSAPTVATGSGTALSITIDPTGRFAYVPITSSTPATVVAQFSIDATTGMLAPLTPAAVSAGGAGAAWVAVDPSGKYAYATSGETGWGSTSIAQYSIDQTTGALTLLPNPTVQSGYGPSEIITVARQ